MAGEPVTELRALESLRAALADRYRIEREIGRGGMATVYLAQDLRHGRQVAIKVLHPDLGALLGVERFLAEIRVTAALQHPNLLPLFDSGKADELLYYVMPYVEGESLRARLTREAQLPIDDAVRIGAAVAGALDYAHRRGVIHRDLKPENILLHEGQPLVADFGIALAVSNAAGDRITRSGMTLGTPQYMAPEQAAGDRSIDGRADLYALGVILYEMLTGEPPHSGPTAQAVIARIISEKPRDLRAAREAIPEHVAWAVEQALAKLPADRFATAREFGEALSQPALMQRRTPPAVVAKAESQARRLRRWLLVAAAIAVTLAAGIAIGRSAGEGDSDQTTVRFHVPLPRGMQLAETANPLAVSPDGRTAALIVRADSAREPRIVLRSLDDPQLRELQGTDGASQLFFSPDGRWLAFYAGSTVRKVSVAGGSPVVIGEVPGLNGASWTLPDQIVVSTEGRLAVIPAAGGQVRPFSAPRGDNQEKSQILPLLLPDGKTIVYTARTFYLEQSTLAVATLGDSATELLELPGTAPLGFLDGYLIYATARSTSERNDLMAVAFDARRRRQFGNATPVINGVVIRAQGPVNAAVSPAGTLLYRSREQPLSQLVMVEPGRPAQVLLGEPGQYDFPRISPDGRRVALTLGDYRKTNVYLLDLASSAQTQLSSDKGSFPEWTPDGSRVIYSKGGPDGIWLWWRKADGSAPEEQLFRSDSLISAAGQTAPDIRGAVTGVLAPNGTSLLMRMNPPAGGRELWYLRLGSDSAPRRLVENPGNEFGPRVSPDGKWLAWWAAAEASPHVYVTPFPGPGPRYQVSTVSGSQPIWARDGQRLFYLSGGNLLAAQLRFTPQFEVIRRDTLFRGEYQFGGAFHAGYDVAPDGRRFVARQALPGSGLPPLVFVHGWREELRARMAQAPQP